MPQFDSVGAGHLADWDRNCPVFAWLLRHETPSQRPREWRVENTGDLSVRMHSKLEQATQEMLAGLWSGHPFHNAENGFCVLRAKARETHNGAVALVFGSRDIRIEFG